jgi:hypothetical protein
MARNGVHGQQLAQKVHQLQAAQGIGRVNGQGLGQAGQVGQGRGPGLAPAQGQGNGLMDMVRGAANQGRGPGVAQPPGQTRR